MRRFTSAPKPARGLAVKFNRVGAVHARAVTNAVEAREVRRSFRGRDDVVSRRGIIRVRQGNLHDFRAELFQFLHRRIHGGADFGTQSRKSYIPWANRFSAPNVAIESSDVIRHRFGNARGIPLIASADGANNSAAVADIFGEWPDLIE